MAWITITEADLLTAISGDELAGYREAALAAGQPDPIGATILQVTNLVRGYIGACARNQLGPEGAIASKLLAPAVDLIVLRIPGRVGAAVSKGRETAGENAIKLLEQVARCAFALEEPVEPAEEQPAASGRPSFRGRLRRNVRRESDGL